MHLPTHNTIHGGPADLKIFGRSCFNLVFEVELNKSTKSTITTMTNTTTTNNTTTSTATPPDVLVMDLNDFFAVPTTTLQQYDIDPYHLFIDDLHSFTAKYYNYAKYSEIALFIDDLYMKRIHTQLYLWVCFDVLQSDGVEFNDHHITSLTHITSYTNPRPLNIPTFDLTKILRNSADIIPVIQKARTQRITAHPQQLSTSNTLGNITGGHNITSTPVVHHQLLEYSNPKHWKNFVTHVLTEVLPSVVDKVASISPSHVGILYYNRDHIDEIALHQLVRKEFNCSTQTIKDFVLKNNKDDVIFDEVSNAVSFEFQVVIYVAAG